MYCSITENRNIRMSESTIQGYIHRIRFGFTSQEAEIDLAKELDVFEKEWMPLNKKSSFRILGK